MGEKEKLSLEDIARLAEDKSPRTRIEVANKLAHQYSHDEIAPKQRELAEQIFRLLLKDAEVLVRRVMSDNLKNVRTVPHDIVLKLAQDVAHVSLPVLEFSEVLNDDDLVSIVNSTVEVACQLAVSRRKDVSEKVSSALVDTKKEEVVSSLLENQSAHISGKDIDAIVNEFSEKNNIVQLLVTHSSVTIELAEKIMNKVSSAIKKELTPKYGEVMEGMKEDILKKGSEVAAMKLMATATGSDEEELMRLLQYVETKQGVMEELLNKDSRVAKTVERLEGLGKLTPFTALCMGSMPLFEITMAKLAKISIFNVRKLVADETNRGFKALYERTGLPERMEEAVHILVNVVRELEKNPEKEKLRKTPSLLASHMTQRIMTLTGDKDVPNLSYFLTMIQHHGKHFSA